MPRLRPVRDNRVFPTPIDWSMNERFRSNNGKGPLIARIVSKTEDTLTMERWYEKRPHSIRVQFQLPAWFLGSPTCGWMPVDAEDRA